MVTAVELIKMTASLCQEICLKQKSCVQPITILSEMNLLTKIIMGLFHLRGLLILMVLLICVTRNKGKTQNVEETKDGNDGNMIGIARMENASSDRILLAGTSKIHSGKERCIMGKTSVAEKKLVFEKATKQAGPSELRSNHSPPSGQKTVDSSSKKSAQSLDKENQDGKHIRQMSKSTSVEPREQTAALEIPNCRDETTSGEDSETSGSVKLADVRPQKGLLHETDLPREQKCPQSVQSSNAMESSVGSNAAKNFINVRNPKGQNLQQPGVPKIWRPRIRWTTEEEMLKEGMHLFYSEHGTYVSWKRILEHGAGVFGKSRTPVDLKDKWRNMCAKGESPFVEKQTWI